MNVLIIYASVEGQTARIARKVKSDLERAGHAVRMVDAQGNEAVSLDDADRIILAAPVHERRHPRLFEALLTALKPQLEARSTLLISVSLSAAFPEGLEEAGEYVTELKMRTGFTPSAELLVAGAVRTGHYDYFATQVLRHVLMRGRDFDPEGEGHEFTEWTALRAGLSAFMAQERVMT